LTPLPAYQKSEFVYRAVVSPVHPFPWRECDPFPLSTEQTTSSWHARSGFSPCSVDNPRASQCTHPLSHSVSSWRPLSLCLTTFSRSVSDCIALWRIPPRTGRSMSPGRPYFPIFHRGPTRTDADFFPFRFMNFTAPPPSPSRLSEHQLSPSPFPTRAPFSRLSGFFPVRMKRAGH